MRIIQCLSKNEAISITASLILEKVKALTNPVIGLATGKTMVPVYLELAKVASEHKTSFDHSFFFMLDEYLTLPENHPSSFRSYINKYVIRPLGINQNQIAFPPVEINEGGEIYERLLKDKGGVDLQLLGIGTNGHVGFNEPGSSIQSRTRVIKLTTETLKANSDQFTDIIPSKALSMGIGTILEAKNLLMLATGITKAEVIKYLLNHHDDPSCPATFLKNHPHFTLILDPEAASKINLNI